MIPWPVSTIPTNLNQLTADAIESFFLSPHCFRMSMRDRLEKEQARWHMDHIQTLLLPNVDKAELQVVKQGVRIVEKSLHELMVQEREKEVQEKEKELRQWDSRLKEREEASKGHEGQHVKIYGGRGENFKSLTAHWDIGNGNFSVTSRR